MARGLRCLGACDSWYDSSDLISAAPPPPPRGQFALYLYYLVVAYVLRAISPPLSQMASQEAALTGSFRAAHQV